MRYAKDDGKYFVNYFRTLGKVDDTAIALINSCRYVYRDENGREYTKVAVSYDAEGNVTFERQYL